MTGGTTAGWMQQGSLPTPETSSPQAGRRGLQEHRQRGGTGTRGAQHAQSRRARARTGKALGRAQQGTWADSLMLSMSSESTTERLCSSPAMARSNAFCFTILLHSWYFILASLSWGFTFTTWYARWQERTEGREEASAPRRGAGQRGHWEAGAP